MNPHHLLLANAVATAACGVVMLAGRGTLPGMFGLESPLLLDVLAVGLLAYAGALALAGGQATVGRSVLLAFTAADAAWVAGSAVVLAIFWTQFTPLARVLVVAVAVVVEVFATLQFRAAGQQRPGDRGRTGDAQLA
jgi:hypothetical protein